MNTRDLVDTVRKYAKIGYRFGIDPDEVESYAIERLYGENFDNVDNVEGYVYVAVKNSAINLYQKQKRQATPVPEFYDSVVGGNEDRNEFYGLIPRVRAHVEEIVGQIEHEKYREAAYEYYINGLSTAQIGELMNTTKGYVGRMLYEARAGLNSSQVADLRVWDSFNSQTTQYNNRTFTEGASWKLKAILQMEGYLP